MKYCTNCGHQLTPNASFCGDCGAPVYKPSNPEVENPASAASETSTATGSSIEAEAYQNNNLTSPISQNTTSANRPTSPVPPDQSENLSPKSRIVAFLLAFFLGTFGAHHFYLRNFGRAICQLVFTILGFFIYIWSAVQLAFTSSTYVYDLSHSSDYFLGYFLLGLFLLMGVGIWAFVDWIIILCGGMKDGNHLPVKNWT